MDLAMERYCKYGERIVRGVLEQFYGFDTFAERKKFVAITLPETFISPRDCELLCDRWYTTLVRSLWGDIDKESFETIDE